MEECSLAKTHSARVGRKDEQNVQAAAGTEAEEPQRACRRSVQGGRDLSPDLSQPLGQRAVRVVVLHVPQRPVGHPGSVPVATPGRARPVAVLAPAPVHSPEDPVTAPGPSLVQQARLGHRPGQKRPLWPRRWGERRRRQRRSQRPLHARWAGTSADPRMAAGAIKPWCLAPRRVSVPSLSRRRHPCDDCTARRGAEGWPRCWSPPC